MNRWEYLDATCYDEKGQLRVHEINGIELPNWKNGPSATGYANRLGAEGWEMVGVVSTALHINASIWFKRQRV